VKPVLAAVVLAILPLTPALADRAQPPAAPAAVPDRTAEVSANGTARVYRKPEYLDVIVGVETIADTAGAANTDCSKRMDDVLKAIKALSLQGAEYQTGAVDLTPRYDQHPYNEPVTPRIVAYSAVNTVRIRTADLKSAPSIIDAALKSGANRIDGVGFGIKQVLEPREEALRMATKAAQRKARVMAESLDLHLERVISVNETTRQYGGWMNNINRSSNLAQVQAVNESSPAEGGESIEPGMIEIVVDVSLAYSLVP
jgi:uncharacterized protein YggE